MSFKGVYYKIYGIARKRLVVWSNMIRRGVLLSTNCKRVAIISSNEWKNKVYDDLLVERAFLKHGVRAEIISWQDFGIDYKKYDAILIGSMWGYQDYLADFERWLSLTSTVLVVNNFDVICENYNKVVQFEKLADLGLPVIETRVIGGLLDSRFEDLVRNFGRGGFVLKPAISGGGKNTFLVRNEIEFEVARKALSKLGRLREFLVQPFVPEIKKGEIGVVIIGGEIVNVVRRFPGVLQGDFKVETVRKISNELKNLAMLAWSAYPGATYMRVDTVFSGGKYKIMEVEAFEPQLYYYLLRGEKRKKMLEKIVGEVLRKIEGL